MNKLALLLLVIPVVPLRAADATSTGSQAPALSAEISGPAILATMKQVADWQLEHPSRANQRYGERAWPYGAFYAGVMALSRIADTPKYGDAMAALGRKFQWEPAPRRYHADDHCVSQMYLELYLRDRDPAMLGPTKAAFDYILEHPATNNLDAESRGANDRWCWCDALFMAPPAWARLAEATIDRRYLDFMDREWRATSDYLYDTNEHLFFRDSTYFNKWEANGKKVFWSRGNGWVTAGLARVLEVMPLDYPNRSRYEEQFREMTAKILSLQQSDGLWRASLLDPGSYPLKETSGSGFFTFALAWGINHGMLNAPEYKVAARKAWTGLVECVTPEGKLEHVQPVGADPKKFDPAYSDVYGTGAFLLAGSEMYRLARETGANK